MVVSYSGLKVNISNNHKLFQFTIVHIWCSKARYKMNMTKVLTKETFMRQVYHAKNILAYQQPGVGQTQADHFDICFDSLTNFKS